MAGHVRIVLSEDVPHLGTAGELVRVRAGYARNFLIPRGKAQAATRGSIEQVENQRKAAVARAAKQRTSAQAVADSLSKVSVEVTRQAGEGNKLYGSVTSKDIAEALAAKGHEVDRKKLQLPGDAIKDVGEYEIKVKLGHEVEGTFKLVVSAAS